MESLSLSTLSSPARAIKKPTSAMPGCSLSGPIASMAQMSSLKLEPLPAAPTLAK